MKKSRFTDSQTISTLKQAEAGTPVAELFREHDMNNASLISVWQTYVAPYGMVDVCYDNLNAIQRE